MILFRKWGSVRNEVEGERKGREKEGNGKIESREGRKGKGRGGRSGRDVG
jgi:hypothetical protein